MIRDPGPLTNLGFGIPVQHNIQEGTGGDTNFVQRALNGHPVMRFFAIAAGSTVGMAMAGKIAHGGSLRLVEKAQQFAKSGMTGSELAQDAIRSFRRIEAHLDDLQGIARQYVDPEDELTLVERVDGRLRRDKIVTRDSFHIRASNQDADPSLANWSNREAIQQKLIAQARRLPYEAPAFYVAQKALIDPLTGDSKDPKNKVNWSNPVDVVGDFAYQTIKNLSTNILPFEIGSTAAGNTYRNTMLRMAQNPGNNVGLTSLKVLLGQVGADVSDLIDRTAKFSHQSTGAFATLIDEASNSGRGYKEWLRSYNSNSTIANSPVYKNANFGRRLFLRAQEIVQNKNQWVSAVDALPAPFKGMGTGISRARTTFKEIGKTYDQWQGVMNGTEQLSSLRRNNFDEYQKLMAFMRKGGGTSLEHFGRSVFNLGNGGPTLPGGEANRNWMGSTFYQQRASDTYNSLLTQALVDASGLPPEEAVKFLPKAQKFISQASKVTRYSGNKFTYTVGGKIPERFKFGVADYHGAPDNGAWWNHVLKTANAHGIGLDPNKITYDVFAQAVKTADLRYSSRNFQQFMQSSISNEWNFLHDKVLPKYATQTLTSVKRSYNLFTGTQLQANKEFLVRRTAQKLGINLLDNTGNAIPTSHLENAIQKRGLNPGNLHTLRGFLVDQKVIDKPWNVDRFNAFGFRSMTIEDALRRNFFAANDQGVQREVRSIISHKTNVAAPFDISSLGQSVTDDIWNLKLNNVFQMPNGRVLDLNRATRGFMSAMDKLASDYQVPLLHLKPAQILGWNSWQANRNMPSVMIASGTSLQPFAEAANKAGERPNFYAWIKTNPRHAKGHLVGIAGDSISGLKENRYDGLFRPNTTNPLNMLGRYGNILRGTPDVPSSQKQESKWKRLFDVSFNQENNLLLGEDSVMSRWYRTLTKKPNKSGAFDGLRSPYRAAAKIAGDGFNVGEFTSELSEGVDNLTKLMRSRGFPRHVLKTLAQDPDFKDIFDTNPILKTDILTAPDELLPTYVKRLLKADIDSVAGTREATRVGKFQQQLKNLLTQGDKQNRFWDLQAPKDINTTGISRRIDQLKGELYDYLAVRTAVMPNSPQSFTDTMHALLGKLDELYTKGVISSAEKAEGRAAVLSLQIENARNLAYESVDANFEFSQNVKAIDHLLSNGVEAKQLLNEVGHFAELNVGVKGPFRKAAAHLFETAPYEKPMQINPTGSDVYFMPNFRSVYNRNKGKAIYGLFNNWGDPEGISGASMPMTHMVARVNATFEMFGMGLDPSRYRGPLDFYARGIIGKRVLPAYIAGTTFMAADRTLGGVVNDKDQNGNRVYSPFFVGKAADLVAAGQVGLAGIVPGGQTASEKREELLHGEVPIRNGRFWALGNTPFKGGRIKYFRPSWYRRLKSGATYAPEMNETPVERLLFGYDYSPLRPLDPYRRERQDYRSRPYPLSGEYFTGPWGPLGGALNATVGRLLKPQKRMHRKEMSYGLQQYLPVGESGAYMSPTPINTSEYSTAQQISSINAGYQNAGYGTSSVTPFYGANGYSQGRGRASDITRQTAMGINSRYEAAAGYPARMGGNAVPFSPTVPVGSMSPRIIPTGSPIDYNSPTMSARRIGYLTQELTGIYGFASASIRENLGFGKGDLAPNRSVLESASRGYSASRSFWNLNLGGLGDFPLPINGQFGNLEFSEILRRFVPKEQAGIDFVNPIPNLIGQQYPWLPGADYPLMNLKTGDPYNKAPDMEIRLPGTGYMRTHQMLPDQYAGQLGVANIHDILGDVAPWSKEYKALDTVANSLNLDPYAKAKIQQTRAQVEAMRYVNEFTPYRRRYEGITDVITEPTSSAVERGWEWLMHRDNYINTKLGAPRTAVEDWERDNVYGATFPKWSTPYQSFIKPAINKYTQRNPIASALAGGALGYLFGVSHEAKTIASVIGGVTGLAAGSYGTMYEAITGRRYIPVTRRKELALEENVDILSYVKNQYNAALASRVGDTQTAAFFSKQATKTMYGANLNATPEQLAMAVPKRKREHFRAMLFAPKQEREQILSTAGRLERRLYQAAWGMPVEDLPDLGEYFEDHELPPPDSAFWDPSINMDTIKIKMGQSMGLDMSQMGFYPQQIQEANLLNPIYPAFKADNSSFSARAQLRRLMIENGISGSIQTMPSGNNRNRVQLMAGIY